jgi:hypothetical protein
MRNSLILSVLIVIAASCSTVKDQGIQGMVQWISGNQMPGPDKPGGSSSKGISREIYIFPAMNTQNYKPVDGFYKEIGSQPIAVTRSSDDGSFKVSLPAGRYSVFSKEERGFFANRYDGDGCINCIEVKSKAYTILTFTIDYDAAY